MVLNQVVGAHLSSSSSSSNNSPIGVHSPAMSPLPQPPPIPITVEPVVPAIFPVAPPKRIPELNARLGKPGLPPPNPNCPEESFSVSTMVTGFHYSPCVRVRPFLLSSFFFNNNNNNKSPLQMTTNTRPLASCFLLLAHTFRYLFLSPPFEQNEFGSLLPQFTSGALNIDHLKNKVMQEWKQISWMRTSNQKVCLSSSFSFPLSSLFFPSCCVSSLKICLCHHHHHHQPTHPSHHERCIPCCLPTPFLQSHTKIDVRATPEQSDLEAERVSESHRLDST